MSMKVTRQLDKVGRVIIPSDFREAFNIQPGGAVDIEVGKDCLIIKAASNLCTVCGKSVENRHHTKLPNGRLVCFACSQDVAKAMMK